jgi:hypothetical protein
MFMLRAALVVGVLGFEYGEALTLRTICLAAAGQKKIDGWLRESLNCSHIHGNLSKGGEENEICGSSGIQTGRCPLFK